MKQKLERMLPDRGCSIMNGARARRMDFGIFHLGNETSYLNLNFIALAVGSHLMFQSRALT